MRIECREEALQHLDRRAAQRGDGGRQLGRGGDRRWRAALGRVKVPWRRQQRQAGEVALRDWRRARSPAHRPGSSRSAPAARRSARSHGRAPPAPGREYARSSVRLSSLPHGAPQSRSSVRNPARGQIRHQRPLGQEVEHLGPIDQRRQHQHRRSGPAKVQQPRAAVAPQHRPRLGGAPVGMCPIGPHAGQEPRRLRPAGQLPPAAGRAPAAAAPTSASRLLLRLRSDPPSRRQSAQGTSVSGTVVFFARLMSVLPNSRSWTRLWACGR